MPRPCGRCGSSTIRRGCCGRPRSALSPARSASMRLGTTSRTGFSPPRSKRGRIEWPRSSASRVTPKRLRSNMSGSRSGATACALSARLAIGAEGRRSLCRIAAGIDTHRRSYPQTALTFNLAHSRPHHAHLDRIPHRGRAVHAGAAAGTTIEPGLRGRSRRGLSPLGACRRGASRLRSSGARIRS